jgi:hypothetical protein
MDELWAVVLSVVGSVGGIGVIIIAVSKFLANAIADKIVQKSEFRLSKELEDFKKKLEHKNYISKTRFDAEFDIYKQLSQATLHMVFENSELFPDAEYLPKETEKQIDILEQKAKSAIDAYNAALRAIRQHAPFISAAMYQKFLDISQKCYQQIDNFGAFRLSRDKEETVRAHQEAYMNCFRRTREISDDLNALIVDLRTYLEKLDVL